MPGPGQSRPRAFLDELRKMHTSRQPGPRQFAQWVTPRDAESRLALQSHRMEGLVCLSGVWAGCAPASTKHQRVIGLVYSWADNALLFMNCPLNAGERVPNGVAGACLCYVPRPNVYPRSHAQRRCRQHSGDKNLSTQLDSETS